MARKRKAKEKTLINRELSWLLFNRRVQMEADNPANPLLERAKFLAIVTSNLDEFVQVRYGEISRAAQGRGVGEKPQGGLSGKSLYRRVNREMLGQQNLQYLLYEGIRSELYLRKVRLYPTFPLTEKLKAREAEIFKEEIRPNIRRLSLQEEPQQKQLHLFVKLLYPRKKEIRFVILALPAALPRLYDLSKEGDTRLLIPLEDILRHHLPGLLRARVEQASAFRVIRNQDFPLPVHDTAEILPAVRDMLRKRRGGAVLRLEVEERMSEEMLAMLAIRFGAPKERRYRVTGPLDLNKLMMSLYGLLPRNGLKYPSHEPAPLPELMGGGLWRRIAAKDILLYHPYHSFAPVAHFLERAAADPAVRSIRQTLYRVSGHSPIIQALAAAAENGKAVTVLLEATARFDEENNLFWGERLERAGCKVLYGLPGLKVHSKVTLVERLERGKLKRYLHLGTGNYHEGTARQYTDFGLLTADRTLGEEALAFFQQLEGYPAPAARELIAAPKELKPALLRLIAREEEHAAAGRPCGILAKMNSLSEEEMIAALYHASGAGVPVRLIVRGLCCLLPGVPGLSKNIRVISIVGRHLEHARCFSFINGGENQVYLSSADWMPRNLQRRAELMFPVKDPECSLAVRNILELQWRDSEKAWQEQPDGSYRRRPSAPQGLNAQETLLFHLDEVLTGKREALSKAWTDASNHAETAAGAAPS